MSIYMYTRDYEKIVQALNPGAGLITGADQSKDAFKAVLDAVNTAERERTQASQLMPTGKPEMESAFQKAADTYGLPVNLLKAVGKAESGFRSDAVSKSGAVGVMQLMPATARGLGVADPYNAEQNIMGGAKFLKNLLTRYEGDVELALAAYNAGPGNVDKYGGIPPFKETQSYVPKVLGYAGEALNISSIQSQMYEAAADIQKDRPVQLDMAFFSGNSYSDSYFDLDMGNISAMLRNNPHIAPVLADLLKYTALSSFGNDEIYA